MVFAGSSQPICVKAIEFWQAAGFRIERGGQEMNYFWAHSEITTPGDLLGG
jgi:hypothetical protein